LMAIWASATAEGMVTPAVRAELGPGQVFEQPDRQHLTTAVAVLSPARQ
jgi:hypothetical protein